MAGSEVGSSMTVVSESVAWYDRNIAAVAAAYEALDPTSVHAWIDGLLPAAPALILDVGAGTGGPLFFTTTPTLGLTHIVCTTAIRLPILRTTVISR